MIAASEVDRTIYGSSSSDDKRAFMASVAEAYGPELRGLYSTTFTAATVAEQDIEMKGVGEYMDPGTWPLNIKASQTDLPVSSGRSPSRAHRAG